MVKVVAAKANDDISLDLKFSDGKRKRFDAKPYLDFEVFKPLKDLNYFKRIKIAFGTVQWKDEQDISPETLYLEGEDIVESEKILNRLTQFYKHKMSDEIQQLGLSKSDKEIADYPEKQQIDYFRDLVKLPISLIPTGSSILDLVFISPISKRKDAWAKDLGEKVQELLENGITIENLQENNKFIDAVYQSTQIALKTSQREKIEALRNAIKNVALDTSLDDSFIQICLQIVDDLTPIHMRILQFFENPYSDEKYQRLISEEFDDDDHKMSISVSELETIGKICLTSSLNLSEDEYEIYKLRLEQERLLTITDERHELTSFGKRFWKFITES